MLRFFGIDPKQSPNIQPLVEFKHNCTQKNTYQVYTRYIYIYPYTSWWFQPHWKIFVKLAHFPNFWGENFKNIWVATSDVTFPSRQPRNSGDSINRKNAFRFTRGKAGDDQTSWEVPVLGSFGGLRASLMEGGFRCSLHGRLPASFHQLRFGVWGWKTSIFVVVPACVPLWANKDGVSCCWLYIVMYVVLSYLNLKQLHPASWWMKQPSVIYSTCLSLALLLTPSDKYWKHGMYRRY